MRIVSIPIGILSNFLKEEVVIKKNWNSKKRTEATTTKHLNDLFLMLYQKIKPKKKYSTNVYPTWKNFLKWSGRSWKKNKKLKQKIPYNAIAVGTTSLSLFLNKRKAAGKIK